MATIQPVAQHEGSWNPALRPDAANLASTEDPTRSQLQDIPALMDLGRDDTSQAQISMQHQPMQMQQPEPGPEPASATAPSFADLLAADQTPIKGDHQAPTIVQHEFLHENHHDNNNYDLHAPKDTTPKQPLMQLQAAESTPEHYRNEQTVEQEAPVAAAATATSEKEDPWDLQVDNSNTHEDFFQSGQVNGVNDETENIPTPDTSAADTIISLVAAAESSEDQDVSINADTSTPRPPPMAWSSARQASFVGSEISPMTDAPLSKPTWFQETSKEDSAQTSDLQDAARLFEQHSNQNSTELFPGTEDSTEQPPDIADSSEPLSDLTDFTVQPDLADSGNLAAQGAAPSDDLAAKWEAALGQDDLLDGDDELDPGSFFSKDDEGFLQDSSDDWMGTSDATYNASQPHPAPESSTAAVSSSTQAQSMQNSAQAQAMQGRRTSSSYVPTNAYQTNDAASWTSAAHGSPAFAAYGGLQKAYSPVPQALANEGTKAQSFVDKSKGGYSSPYDAPMDLSRPKRRAPAPTSFALARGVPSAPPPPPRSSSMHSTAPGAPAPALPTSPHSTSFSPFALASPALSASAAALPSRPSMGSFFEELPQSVRPRPSASTRLNSFAHVPPSPTSIGPPKAPPPPPASQYAPSPASSTYAPSFPPRPPSVPQGLSRELPPLPGSSQIPTRALPQVPSQGPPAAPTSGDFGLVQPERMNLFDSPTGASASSEVPAPSTANTRYSPAPPAMPSDVNSQAMAPPVPPPRAPSASLIHAFQPRTSSPLARSSSASQAYIPQSLPGSNSAPPPGHSAIPPGAPPGVQRPEQPGSAVHPALSTPNLTNGSLPKQARHQTFARGATYHHPLEQSQILSPGTNSIGGSPHVAHTPLDAPFQLPGTPDTLTSQPQLPASSESAFAPPELYSASQKRVITASESRHIPAVSGAQNLLAPADDPDPLQRWQGAPIFRWGFGGVHAVCFPQRSPRYPPGQRVPVMKAMPGEVHIHDISISQSVTGLEGFPGPLKNKSKKKEVLDWTSKKVQSLQEQSNTPALLQASTSRRQRHEEKTLLWQVVQTLVEYDGNVDSSDAVVKAFRQVLSPHTVGDVAVSTTHSTDVASSPIAQNLAPAAAAANVGLQGPAVDTIREYLLRGEREKAVWHAVDQKLWGHAMLLASTLPRETWKQVIQEFVRSDVRSTGNAHRSLAALYETFAGNLEESVDELVPPSARAGLHLVSKTALTGPATDGLSGLDQWRETLSLMLSNRSADDTTSMVALGQLLLRYNRVEAAHICFIFAKHPSMFGGPSDPQAAIVLLGVNHQDKPPSNYMQDQDALLLTEIYEYAHTVLAPSTNTTSTPHLQSLKLHHAELLAERGLRDQALQYCDAIATALKATTKASPYYHARLYASLDDLQGRIRQSNKDGSGSWISKPSMDKVSGSVWNKFNKFVAGDDSDAGSSAASRPDVDGPFARINGDTPPSISRGSSPIDAYAALGGGATIPNNMHILPSNSRYAPAGMYNTTTDRSLTMQRGPSNASSPDRLRRPGLLNQWESQASSSSRYTPDLTRQSANPYMPQGQSAASPHMSQAQTQSPSVYMPHVQEPEPAPVDPYLAQAAPTAPANPDGLSAPANHSRFSSSSEHPPLRQSPSPSAGMLQPGQTSPLPDRHSGSYEPRSAGSSGPRSASYESRPVTSRPRSYEPSPVSTPSEPREVSYESAYEPNPALLAPANPHHSVLSNTGSAASFETSAESIDARSTDHSTASGAQDAPSYPNYGYQPFNAVPMTAGSAEDLAETNGNPTEPGSGEFGSGMASTYAPPMGGYAPPSYDPEGTTETPSDNVEDAGRRVRTVMDMDDDDDELSRRIAKIRLADQKTATSTGSTGSSRADNDRIAEENVRRAREEDAQRDRAAASSQGSWLGRIWGRGAANGEAAEQPKKAIKAKLGDKKTAYYDDVKKKWVFPNANVEDEVQAPTPPPPKGPPRRSPSGPAAGPSSGSVLGVGIGSGAGTPPVAATPPPPVPGIPAMYAGSSAPVVVGGAVASHADLPHSLGATPDASPAQRLSGSAGLPPSGSASMPPSRPATGMSVRSGVSNASSAAAADDMYGPLGARKGGTMGRKKKGRGYVDVLDK